MFYYTYVLRSKKDGYLYIGWSKDLSKIVNEHQKGFVDSTKHRLPIELIYYEACLSEKKSIEREKQLKTGFWKSIFKKKINLILPDHLTVG